jgi:hypothetical protein
LTVDYGDEFYRGIPESDRERADDVDDEGGEDLRPVIRSLIPEVDSTDEDADDAPLLAPRFAELGELFRDTLAARKARKKSRAAPAAPADSDPFADRDAVDITHAELEAYYSARAAPAAPAAPVVAVVPAPGIAPVVLSAARIAEIRAGGHCSSAESAALGALDDVAAVAVPVKSKKKKGKKG